MILNEIINKKKIRLAMQKEFMSAACLMKSAKVGAGRDFYAALNGESIAVIAEVKKASPSKGMIKENFDPVQIAKAYVKGGAAAISVLTEQDYFLGSDQYLADVKKAAMLPILRKDFIIDEYQIYQAKAMGADAILLIAAILNDKQLKAFHALAKQLNLHVLTEAHTREEVECAAAAGAEIIGINNRNLKTFEVDIHTTERLLPFIPEGVLTVSESGIKTHADLAYLEGLGIHAVLVGETLMRADNMEAELKMLRGKL